MEQLQIQEINNIFEQVAELSQSVIEYVKNVNVVSSQSKKVLDPAEETNEHPTSYLNLGKEDAKLFVDLTQTTKEVVDLLGKYNEKTSLEIDMVQFLKNLEDSENFKRRNIEVQRYFKILAIGLKGIADVRTGKPDTSTESLDTIFAFSDFLSENPEVATSSPLH